MDGGGEEEQERRHAYRKLSFSPLPLMLSIAVGSLVLINCMRV